MTPRIRNISVLLIVLLAVFIRLLFLGHDGYTSDFNYFEGWSNSASEKGTVQAYKDDKGIDYPPVYVYFLDLVGRAYRNYTSDFNTILFDDILRLANIFVDISIGLLMLASVVKLLDSNPKRWQIGIAAACLYLFNPYVIYVTSIWGQVDGWLMLFVNLFICTILYTSFRWHLIPIAIGLLVKIQALILLPIIFLYTFVTNKRSQWFQMVLTSFATFIIVASPFIFGNAIPRLVSVYSQASSRYPYYSLNAYNYWWLFSDPSDYSAKTDSEIIIDGLDAKSIGLFMFGISYAIILLYVAIQVIGNSTSKKRIYYFVTGMTLVAIAFYLFPTQMHERYMFMVFGLLPILVSVSRWWWPVWLILTTTQLLNVMKVLPYNTDIGEIINNTYPQMSYLLAVINIIVFVGILVILSWQIGKDKKDLVV